MGEKAEMLNSLKDQWIHILHAFGEAAVLQQGQLVVIGCSTSEILGKSIGKAGSKEVADILVPPLLHWADGLGICLAFQCCEHLNRVLVVEKKCVERYGLEPVIVVPSLTAGGAMSLAAWEKLNDPVAVEQIKAHAGIDIGDTLIGMHLRPVAVPVRIDVKHLGNAHVTLAKTRPKYIGGPRAAYPCS
ncbi:MAG: TIGR01440 family protein [Peptococcaceae bacterium]|nr:TIGR01440 family protein [Peptococcaceae bacterium]